MGKPSRSNTTVSASFFTSTTCAQCRLDHSIFTLRFRRKCTQCKLLGCTRCMTTSGGSKDPLCRSCASKLRKLTDTILMYIESFLPVDSMDRFLRVCRRFQRLVLLPYPSITHIKEMYEICDLIHENHNTGSKIYRVIDRVTKQSRALKVIPKTCYFTRQRWQNFQLLVNISFATHHPNFVDVFAVHQTSSEVLVAYELLDIVPLDRFPRALEESHVIHIALELLRALKYLHHDLKVVHMSLQQATMIDPSSLQVKILLKPTMVMFGSKDFPEAAEVMAELAASTSPSSRGAATNSSSSTSATSRVFLHRTKAIARPSPVIIPGGRDESLFRKCTQFRNAAAQRQQIFSDMEGRRREFSGVSITDASLNSSFTSSFASFRGEERNPFLYYPWHAAIGYTAPELAVLRALEQPKHVTAKQLMACDMFTVGVMLYRCLTAELPWRSERWRVMSYMLWNRLPASLPELYNKQHGHSKTLSWEANHFVMNLLRRDAEKRSNVKQALSGPWIQDGRTSSLLVPPDVPKGHDRPHASTTNNSNNRINPS